MSSYESTMLIAKAAAFAATAHTNQLRKSLNESFISHPLRVGARAAELDLPAEFIAAGFLHDVLEDTDVSVGILEKLFPVETVDLVKAVTKTWKAFPKDGEQEAYYTGVCNCLAAPVLKMLDRIDNLRDLLRVCAQSPSNTRWARSYMAKTMTEFAPVINAMMSQKTILDGVWNSRKNVELEVLTEFQQVLSTLATELARL